MLGVAAGILAAAVATAGFRAFMEWPDDSSAQERLDAYLSGASRDEFFAADGQFRATFPGLPDRSIERTDLPDVGTLDTVLYISDLGDSAVAVGFFDLGPGDTFDLNAGLNGAAVGAGGRIETATPTTWQGVEALEGEISVREDDGVVKVLLVRASQRIYMLEVVQLAGASSEAYEQFKSSFEIVT